MNNYKTSKDYKHLKKLLDDGYQVVCFCTYDWADGEYVTDICSATCYDGRYQISARGIEYGAYWRGMHRFKSFEDMCTQHNIEFIEPTLLTAASDPDRPAYANLVVELKQYLATTPPEQQQRDWEQIKAELPDEGQVPVIFYGLSGSTSHTSTSVTPVDTDEDLVKAQAQMKFREVSYIHSQLVGPQALLDFDQFLALARYFSTYSLNRVLAETERRISEIKSGWLEKKCNDSYGGGALDYLTHILVYIKSLLSAPKHTPSATKK